MSAARARGEGPSAAYWTGFVIVVGALALSPLVLPEFWQRFATEILIWGLLAMASDLLIGYTGMVSFGHSAFFGLGMYGAAAALIWAPGTGFPGWFTAAYGSIPKLW